MSREHDIIQLIAQSSGQTEAMADDAFWDPRTRLVYTTDMLVEGRHFSRAYFSPQDLGWKAAAVNISDLAGMGAQLKHLLISLGLPDDIDLPFIQALYEGFREVCQRFGGIIAGGDTVGSPVLTINVTAVGECSEGSHPGRRFLAQPGDYIIASGFHGLSKVGLTALQQQWPDFSTSKACHLRPTPRIEAGQTLAKKFERYALMDSSDGLADALIKMAVSSQQTFVIERRKIHLHPEVMAYSQKLGLPGPEPEPGAESIALHTALYGGEDFELVATVPQVDADILARFHVIGRVEKPDATRMPVGAYVQDTQTGTFASLSLSEIYQHFKGPDEGIKEREGPKERECEGDRL